MSKDGVLPAPPDLAGEVFTALQDKAALPVKAMIVLGMLAGAYIGLGGLFALTALAGADALPFGVGQVLAGAVFTLGLALVIVAGAELFTGNMLFAGPVAARQIPLRQAAKALSVVYLANFAGALVLSVIVLAAGVHEAGEGAVGQAAIALAQGKVGNGALAMFASGVLANMLVCLAVWMAGAARTVSQKIVGLFLPVMAFVAMGLEHSVANMYLLPYGWMVQSATLGAGEGFTVAALLGNLVPATLGNMAGGALVALAYWQAYLRHDRAA